MPSMFRDLAYERLEHDEAIQVLKKERESFGDDINKLKNQIAMKQLKINAITYVIAATELYMVNRRDV